MGEIEEVDAVVSTIGGTPADPTADSQVVSRCQKELWHAVAVL